ncbi:ZIP family metal transporter [Sphingomonas oligophenolica]|uniref:Zinc transporter n=1 Tax=Sphingomonas oligophenolica TaxID=301154 RepID=A0A502CTW9_9SPHN|nr:zinc transporter [Sphingomonas oligophenolica]TPG15256.1 zinc transporter [Sphingomonas oligophenolica]
MLTTIVVVFVVSGALLLGAAWGIFWYLPKQLEGFLIALAGGALIVSALSELIEPALAKTSLLWVTGFVAAGAVVFTIADKLVGENLGEKSGGGLLASITLDGIPENLALGVALIGAGPMQVAALAGSIFLSNLPEAAGGAKEMAQNRSKGQVFGLWAATALLLSVAAIAGNLLLAGVAPEYLAAIRCFAAGAVIASLATAVFPKAYREESYTTGLATALGLLLALALGELGGK